VGVGYFTHTLAASPAAHDRITLGSALLLSSAPVWVAADRGYFERHGLNVTLREYDTGLSAATGVESGEDDLALSGEYALVRKVFANESLLGLDSVSRSELMYLVGRRDRGVVNGSDLAGKRVGLPGRIVSELYPSRFVAVRGQSLTG
jgi:NitT/TauT family transport system substrate-binding protein